MDRCLLSAGLCSKPILRVCLKNSIVLLCCCYVLSLYRYVCCFLLSLTYVGALPSPPQPPAGCPCGWRGVAAFAPWCRAGFSVSLQVSPPGSAAGGTEPGVLDTPFVEIRGAGRLTVGEEGGGFNPGYRCSISARSRLPAAVPPALQLVEPEHCPAGAGAGPGQPVLPRAGVPPARSLASVVPARVTEGFALLGGAKSGFLCVGAIAFGSPPFIIFFFIFSCERYFRGAVAPSHALPNCSLAIPWLPLVA